MIVGIYSNLPQSGKSTVSNQFKLRGYQPLSFATPVKQSLNVVLSALGIQDSHEYLWGDKKDEIIPGLDVTGGYLMSAYASDFFREMINEDVWLNILARNYTPYRNTVVDDMRFPNEHRFIKRQGGYTIQVVRPGVVEHSRSTISEGRLANHPFDFIIRNDDDKEELRQRTDIIIDLISYDQLERFSNE